MNDINKAINHLIMLKRLDSGEKKYLYDLAIKALEKELSNGWILCSERLPEQRYYNDGSPIEYNVMLRYGTVATTAVIDRDGIWGDVNWNTDTFHQLETEVIAWQPLPEPYKELATDNNVVTKSGKDNNAKDTALSPEEAQELKAERDYWEKEAKKWCAKLGEIRLWISKQN